MLVGSIDYNEVQLKHFVFSKSDTDDSSNLGYVPLG